MPRLICTYPRGQRVWLRMGEQTEQDAGIVVSVAFPGYGPPLYAVSWGKDEETQHFECELADSPYASTDDKAAESGAPEDAA